MKTVIIALAASVISIGAFAASHAEKGAMAKPAASAPMAKSTTTAKAAPAPAANSASGPTKKTTSSAKKAKKPASAPA